MDIFAAWEWQDLMEDEWNRQYRPLIEQHWASLFESISSYVKETKTNSLKLNRFRLENEHLQPILALIKASNVTDLDLSENSFEDGIEGVAKLFTKTKLTKLNLRFCDLTDDDAFYLMEVLKDTKISDLDLSQNEIEFCDESDSQMFVSFLQKSHLTALNLRGCYLGETGTKLMIQALPHTSITKLNLTACSLKRESLAFFSNLPAMPILELNLSDNEISHDGFAPIARALRDSKLEKLDLSTNELNDDSLILLMENLAGSKLTSLDLSGNNISGSHSLGHYLRNSKIESFTLRGNQINEGTMLLSPFLEGTSVTTLSVGWIGDELGSLLIRSLKNSVVTKLNLSASKLRFNSINTFAEVVKDTLLEDVDFSFNYLSPAEILVLGESLKGSKVRCINLSYIFKQPEDSAALSGFIEKIKNTPVKVVEMRSNGIDCNVAESIFNSLPGSTFTHFDLENNNIGNGAVYLGEQLKYTAITHLNLSGNEINDKDAAALAEGLKESQVMELNLNSNLLTSPGASALALNLKKSSLISLKLNKNKIGVDGFEALAEQAKNSLLTNFVGEWNAKDDACSGERVVNKLTFKNKILSHKIVEIFNDLKPKYTTQHFRFKRGLNREDKSKFLEECCQFYKNVRELPAVITVLSQESQFSRSQLSQLLLEDFPKQLTLFIEKEVKPDFIGYLNFLDRVNECLQNKSGLSEISNP